MSTPLWSDLAPSLTAMPTLSGRTTTDVCVVGLGGSGLAALSELARRGVDAIGVDGGEVAGGAAGRNGGFLLAGLAHFHHDAVGEIGRDRAVACYRATEACREELIAAMPGAVRRVGSLRIAVDDGELADCTRQREAMERDGLAVERYEGPEGVGLLYPEDAAFQPVTGCRQVAGEVSAAGVRLFERSPVVGIDGHGSAGSGASARPAGQTDRADGVIVRCASGRVHARSVLVCVDGRLEQLLPQLAGHVRSARLQMLATEPVASRVTDRLAYLRYGFDYYQQLPSGEIVLGGFRDAGGEGEWSVEAAPSARVQGALDGFLAEVVDRTGEPVPEVTHRWAGIVGYTPSGLPLVRQVDDGVFVAGGYCGTGNIIGRVAGRALVELACDGRSAMAELFDAPD